MLEGEQLIAPPWAGWERAQLDGGAPNDLLHALEDLDRAHQVLHLCVLPLGQLFQRAEILCKEVDIRTKVSRPRSLIIGINEIHPAEKKRGGGVSKTSE